MALWTITPSDSISYTESVVVNPAIFPPPSVSDTLTLSEGAVSAAMAAGKPAFFNDIFYNSVDGSWTAQSPITVGTDFKVSRTCKFIGIEFYVDTRLFSGAQLDFFLFNSVGTAIASGSSGLGSFVGWASIPLSDFGVSPVTLTAGLSYRISYCLYDLFDGSLGGYLGGTNPGSGFKSDIFTVNGFYYTNGVDNYPVNSTSTNVGADIKVDEFYTVNGPSDTNTLSDAVSTFTSIALSPSDTFSFTENVKAAWGMVVSDTNVANWNDAVAFSFGAGTSVVVTDGYTILDSVGQFISTNFSVVGDQVALADSYLGATAGIPLSISDTLVFSDLNSTGPIPILVDSLSIIDFVRVFSGIPFRITRDSLIFNDGVTGLISQFRNSSDTNTLTDNFNYTLPSKAPTDTNTISDAAAFTLTSIFVNLNVFSSDSIQLFDSRQVSGRGIAPKLGDSFSLQDAVYPLLNSVQNDYYRNYLNDTN